jgi:antitoxin VapB
VALTIESPEADRLARELSEKTGQSLEQAVVHALRRALLDETRERIEREAKNVPATTTTEEKASVEELLAIVRAIKKTPVVDPRSADEILGYDEWGLPH